jgi:hypothetical protein
MSLPPWDRVTINESERKPKPGTSKLHALVVYPIYLYNDSSYIESENGVGFANEYSTTWLPSIFLSRAWERMGTGVCATMGTAANQRCATMGTVPIVAGVHTGSPQCPHCFYRYPVGLLLLIARRQPVLPPFARSLQKPGSLGNAVVCCLQTRAMYLRR